MTDRRISLGRFGTLIAVLCLLVGCAGSSAEGSTVAYRADDLRTGAPVDLADFRGKVVLLSGWATWCPPCREELPDLNALYEARRSDGLVVTAVNLDAAGPSTRAVLPMVEDMGLTMPTWIDTENEFAVAFGAVSMPTNVLIDRDGVVRETWNGAIDLDDAEVIQIIDQLLDHSES